MSWPKVYSCAKTGKITIRCRVQILKQAVISYYLAGCLTKWLTTLLALLIFALPSVVAGGILDETDSSVLLQARLILVDLWLVLGIQKWPWQWAITSFILLLLLGDKEQRLTFFLREIFFRVTRSVLFPFLSCTLTIHITNDTIRFRIGCACYLHSKTYQRNETSSHASTERLTAYAEDKVSHKATVRIKKGIEKKLLPTVFCPGSLIFLEGVKKTRYQFGSAEDALKISAAILSSMDKAKATIYGELLS